MSIEFFIVCAFALHSIQVKSSSTCQNPQEVRFPTLLAMMGKFLNGMPTTTLDNLHGQEGTLYEGHGFRLAAYSVR